MILNSFCNKVMSPPPPKNLQAKQLSWKLHNYTNIIKKFKKLMFLDLVQKSPDRINTNHKIIVSLLDEIFN